MQPAPIRPGDVLAGKYRVERVLGAGGMGVVVAALHLQLDERVALKFLLPEALANDEAVARFAREARAAAKIKSEHVARVTDVGRLEGGAPYMVMEYLEGCDLADLLRRQGPLPVATAVQYVLEACEALAEAHSLGIVHRDLKPSNLFLASRRSGPPIVKILDFGISKVRPVGATADMAMTKTSSVMGSPLYMSPEQMAASRDVDPRSDIWSLGAVLYQLLTASAPFVADTMPELCAKILTAPAAPLRACRPDVPEGLEAAILRCLEKNREHRFPTVAHLAAALVPFAPQAAASAQRIAHVLGVDPLAATAAPTTEPMPHAPPVLSQPWAVPGPVPVAPPAVAAGTHASWGGTRGPQGASSTLPYVLGIVGMGLFVGAMLVAFVLWRTGSARQARPASAPPAATALPAVEDTVSDPLPPLATGRVVPPAPAPPPPAAAASSAARLPAPPPVVTFVLPTVPAQTTPPPHAAPPSTHAPPPPAPTKPDIF